MNQIPIEYCVQIIDEIQGGLDAWDAADRWTTQGIIEQVHVF